MSNQAGLGLGDKVHTQEINEYPEDLKQEYLQLSTWIKALASHYGRNIVVRLIDPQSLVGMWKLIRNQIRQYPTFIVDNEEKYVGWQEEGALHKGIISRLKDRGMSVPPKDFSMTPEISSTLHGKG